MAITYQLKTFADLYSAVREELKIQSTDTTSLQRIQRDVNIIYLDEVVPFSNWRWLRGNLNVSVQAAFVSGTASVVQNSSTVTLTIAPASSRTRYYFSVVGYNEIYRIQSHTSGSTSLVLEAPYTGSTSATASFKIWSDEIPLPSMVRETTTITHDFQDIPLENCGLQKFRAYVASLPKAEGRPQFYTCESYSDPGYYVTNAALPAVSTRASSTLQKTLVFASDVTTYLPQGTRFRVQTSGDSTYNGEYVVATQSGTTITYTGIYPLEESATADATISIQIGVSASNDRRYKRLLIYPSINTSNQMLHVDFLKEVAPLVNDTDEPLMPIGDRVVLLYGALARAWARERNPEESARNVQMYEAKLARMAGKVDDSIEPPMLRINRVYLGAKRSNTRQRGNSYGAPNGWVGGSGSSSALPQNTANRVAVFDATGTLNADTLVSPTELEKLDGIGSSAVGVSDSQTLTNKTVDASLNTITNIADANVKANAAIAYSKLALTGSILNADLAGSIALSKLATIANNTILGNNSGSTSVPIALTAAQVNTLLGSLSNPMTTGGDVIYGGASGTPTRLANGSSLQTLQSAGGTSAPVWATTDSASYYKNGTIAASIASNILTIALKDKAGSDASATSKVLLGFRDSTLTVGTYSVRTVSAALSVTLGTAVSLGLATATSNTVYVYALDNAGTVELFASAHPFWDEGITQTSSTTGTSNQVLYGANVRSSKAVRLVGRVKATWTSGTGWSSITEVTNTPFHLPALVAKANSCATSFTSASAIQAVFTVKESDVFNAYDTGTGLFTCPVDSVYEVSSFLLASATSGVSAGNVIRMGAKKNGTGFASMGCLVTQVSSPSLPHVAFGTTTLKCVAGDTIAVEVSNGDSTFGTDNNSRDTWVSFKRIV